MQEPAIKTMIGMLAVCGMMFIGSPLSAEKIPTRTAWKIYPNGPLSCKDESPLDDPNSPVSGFTAPFRSDGCEADGSPLWVCAAEYKGGLHPGKIRREFGGCNIPWGGREITIKKYFLLAHSRYWIRASHGNIPKERRAFSDRKVWTTFPVGYEANGDPLWICRAWFKGGLHPGKVRPAFKGCNIPWGGREHTVAEYELRKVHFERSSRSGRYVK